MDKGFFHRRSTESEQDFHFRLGQFSGKLGIVINLALCSTKIAIGLLSSSISILADGVNNLSDIFSSVVTIFSFYISKKPADKEHPFGHARAEYLCASLVAIIIGMLGLKLMASSIVKVVNPELPRLSLALFFVLVFSIAVKIILSIFYEKMAKKIQSSVLKATALDARSDVLSTSVILVSFLVYALTGVSVDGILGMVVSFFILRSAFDIVRDTIDHLVGHAPSFEQIDKVRTFITSYEGIHGIHDLILHDYGVGHWFGSAHVEVDSQWSLLEAHALVDKIEADAISFLQLQLVLHTDPVIQNDPVQNEAFKKVSAVVERFNCSMHDFRVVHAHDTLNVIFDIEIPETCTLPNDEILACLRSAIREADSTYNAIITIDRNYTRFVPET